jgi:hypothetical protein
MGGIIASVRLGSIEGSEGRRSRTTADQMEETGTVFFSHLEVGVFQEL